jgi:hypothetical protein
VAILAIALGSPCLGLSRGAGKLPVRFDIAGVVHATEQVRPPQSPIFAAFPAMWRYYLPGAPVGALPPPMDIDQAREIWAWQRESWRDRSLTVWWWMQAGQDHAWSKMGPDWPLVWVTERAGAEGMAFTTDPGRTVPLGPAVRDHAEVEHRGLSLAFYGNGSAEVPVDLDGTLAVWLLGTPGGPSGEFRQPLATLQIGEQAPLTVPVPAQVTRLVIGQVRAGERLHVAFTDDYFGPGDRNVWITRVEVFGVERTDITQEALTHGLPDDLGSPHDHAVRIDGELHD